MAFREVVTKLMPALVLISVTSGCGADGQPEGAEAPTVTVTATVTETAAATSAEEVQDVESAQAPEPVSDADLPDTEDFAIELRTTEKQCFGSAGCNVTVTIDPTYVGVSELPDSFAVTYEVRGGEDGPQVNTFTVEGDTISYDSEERISTSDTDAELEAVVTDVFSN